MNTSEKQYYIYIRSTKEQVPVTKQEFDDYYRDINAFRRTRMNRKLCVCPKSQWLSCDMDCFTCPYKRGEDELSTDISQLDEAGLTHSWIESISDDSAPMDEILSDVSEMRRLLDRLQELMPEAVEIGKLRLSGLSDRDIEKKIGIGRKTFGYRLKRVKDLLEKEFPDFF